MENIKLLFINRFRTFSLIGTSITLSMVLLMIRMKITHSYFYLFLVWNLFLAVIPFAITTYLISNPKLNKFGLLVWSGVWLLFLPNAPYIITDLIHLRLSTPGSIWIDLLIVSSFAFNGLLLFYLSILDMINMWRSRIHKILLNLGVLSTLFLSGFGVYLGRFLRYNSWEILSDPKYLFGDIMDLIIHPYTHSDAWLFILLFGAFLTVGFRIFNLLYSKPST